MVFKLIVTFVCALLAISTPTNYRHVFYSLSAAQTAPKQKSSPRGRRGSCPSTSEMATVQQCRAVAESQLEHRLFVSPPPPASNVLRGRGCDATRPGNVALAQPCAISIYSSLCSPFRSRPGSLDLEQLRNLEGMVIRGRERQHFV